MTVNASVGPTLQFWYARLLTRYRRKARALEVFRAVVRDQPRHHRAWSCIGFLLAENEQLEPAAQAFERAAIWRTKFEELTWLFASVARLRAAVDALSFVYEVEDRGGNGDDRVYLVRHGVAESRLTARGYGPADPVDSNATAAGRARNRRVELHRLE